MSPRHRKLFGTVFQIIGILTVVYWVFIGISRLTLHRESATNNCPASSKTLILGTPYHGGLLPNGAQEITIPIIKKKPAGDAITSISFYFYEEDSNGKNSPTKSELKTEWLEPANWQDMETIRFHISYPGPVNPSKSKPSEYKITLYHNGEVQDELTNPLKQIVTPISNDLHPDNS